MKLRQSRRTLAVLAVALVGLLAIERSRAVRTPIHDQVSDDLRGLKAVDAHLNQHVLEARFRRLLHYGPLVQELETLAALRDRLARPPAYLPGPVRKQMARTAEQYSHELARKWELIEHFKSRNAILNNSSGFVPIAFAQLIAALRERGAAPRDIQAVQDLLRDALLYQVAADTLLAPAVRARIAALQMRDAHLPAPIRPLLAVALGHTQTLLLACQEVDALVHAALEVPTSNTADQLSSLYSSGHAAALETSNRTRLLLYVICAALLFAVAHSILALRRTAREVADANARLEQRVQERTEELTSSASRFRSLVEGTQAVPWEFDTAGDRLAYIAPQSRALFGIDPEDASAPGGLWRLVHPDDEEAVRRFLSSVACGGNEQDRVDFRIVSPDGRIYEVRSTATLDGSSNRSLLRGIILDMTAQKKLEFELRQAQKLESVGRLAAGVAHEINTPVQFVSDSVHFVRDGMRELVPIVERLTRTAASVRDGRPDLESAAAALADAEAAEMDYVLDRTPQALDRALDGLERVATIVRSLKEFAHPDQPDQRAMDLNQGIRSTLVIARNEYKYVADLTTEYGELPPVWCHAGEINQVVLNIVVNAAHAIAEKIQGTESRGTISVRTSRDGNDALIEITDTGGGIPEAIRDRIFDPFFTTKEVGRGTGQGLAIARNVVVEKHGGRIEVESEVGVGSTFRVWLPIGSGDLADRPQARAA